MCFHTVLRVFHSQRQLLLENLALRQQLLVLKRSVPRPHLRTTDRFFWVILRRYWSRWTKVLVLVSPRTVIGWHRLGFRLFWRWKSRRSGGLPCVDSELIKLIRRMWLSNPTWGSRRIQAELAKLGLNLYDSQVSAQTTPFDSDLEDLSRQSRQRDRGHGLLRCSHRDFEDSLRSCGDGA